MQFEKSLAIDLVEPITKRAGVDLVEHIAQKLKHITIAHRPHRGRAWHSIQTAHLAEKLAFANVHTITLFAAGHRHDAIARPGRQYRYGVDVAAADTIALASTGC